MCGRYPLEVPDPGQIAARFPALRQLSIELQSTYNAAPWQALPVIVEPEPDVWEMKLMHWGLLPRWTGGRKPLLPPINARAETLTEKSMFKKLVGTHRCLVPASGFYEWRRVGTGQRKQPYFIHPTDQRLFAFAGLWDDTKPDGAPEAVAGSFTIITTAPNAMMAELHDRMPVMLEPREEATWLSTGLRAPEAVIPLLDAYPADRMEAYPVSTDVNDVRNNGPRLIDRVDAARKPAQRSLFS